MNLAERFGRLLGRLWPLALPLLLMLAWPLARPIAREHAFGSPLFESPLSGGNFISLSEVWGELVWGGPEEINNPLPGAAARPNDLNLQVWEWNWSHARNEIRSNLPDLTKRFPTEIVVYALVMRDLSPNHKLQTPSISKPKAAEIARLQTLAKRAAQLEPENAYWWEQLASVQELGGQSQGALLSLERAARCSVYDNKDREIVRRSLAAFAPRRALTWEEKRAIFLMSQLYSSPGNARDWGNRARFLAKRGDARGALRWSAALASVGDLMSGAGASVLTSNNGRIWQREAWSIGAPPGTTVRQRNFADFSERFALYAIRNGRPDLAKPTRAQAARARQIEALLATAQARTDDFWLTPDALGATLRAARIAGVVLLGAAIYLSLWWIAANVFLYRALGEPSPRRARVLMSGAVTGALLLLAALAGQWFWRDSLRPLAGAVGPQHQALEAIYVSLGVFAFIAAPWLLASAVTALTLWRERAQFALPPRVDMELQLSSFSRRLLRWALPLSVVGSALALLGGWTLTMLALWFGWRSVDVLSWLPPDRNGVVGSLLWGTDANLAILSYGMGLCVLCLFGWFAKWCWGTPQSLRPFTHGALRTWKESLGCCVAWLMWIYLLLILLSSPARTRADARLDAVLQRGEIAVVRDLKSL